MGKESIGALWIKKIVVKGEEVTILKGNIDGKKYVIYKNGYKKEDKHPDYKVFVDDFVPKSGNTEKAQTGHAPEKANDLPF